MYSNLYVLAIAFALVSPITSVDVQARDTVAARTNCYTLSPTSVISHSTTLRSSLSGCPVIWVGDQFAGNLGRSLQSIQSTDGKYMGTFSSNTRGTFTFISTDGVNTGTRSVSTYSATTTRTAITSLTTGVSGSGSISSGASSTSTKQSSPSESRSTGVSIRSAHVTTTSKPRPFGEAANTKTGSTDTRTGNSSTQASSSSWPHQSSTGTKNPGNISTRPTPETSDSRRATASESNIRTGLGSIKPGDQLVTVGNDVFEVDPANIILNGATVRPGSGLVTVDGHIFFADSARDLFADGTEILTASVTRDTTRTSRSSVSSPTTAGNSRRYVSASTTVFSNARSSDKPTTITTAPNLVSALDIAGPAASQSGIILAALLLKFSKDHQDVEDFIINPVVKQKFKDDTEHLREDALTLFEEIGGVDPETQDCASGKLLDFLEKAACSVQSVKKLSKDLDDEDPDVDEIEGDVDDIGDLGSELQTPRKPQTREKKKKKKKPSTQKQSTQKTSEASSMTNFNTGTFLTKEAFPPMFSEIPDYPTAQILDLVGGLLQSMFAGQMPESSGFQTSRTTKPSSSGNPHAGGGLNIPGNIARPIVGNGGGGATSSNLVPLATDRLQTAATKEQTTVTEARGGSPSSSSKSSAEDKNNVTAEQATVTRTNTQERPNSQTSSRDSKAPISHTLLTSRTSHSSPISHTPPIPTKPKPTPHKTSTHPSTSIAPPAPNTGIAIWLQEYTTSYGYTIATWFAYTYTPSHQPPTYGNPCSQKPAGDTSVPAGIDLDDLVHVFPTKMDISAYGKKMLYGSDDDTVAGWLADTTGGRDDMVASCKVIGRGSTKYCADRTLMPVVKCEWRG
ncbi:hypothetical protein MMC21_003767 [Puttea exsequens]|nr:hypothetical protein [Puttea exsequens]